MTSHETEPTPETTPDTGPDFPETGTGIPAVWAALDYVNQKTRALAKSQRNKEQGYSFRGIDDLYNALHPLLATARIITIPGDVLEVRSEQRMTKKGFPQNWVLVRRQYRIVCLVDGSETIAEGIGEAMDSGDKGANKAQTNAHKYLFFQLFTIPTDEPESDHHQPEASGVYRNQTFERWDAGDPDTWGPAAMGQRAPANPWEVDRQWQQHTNTTAAPQRPAPARPRNPAPAPHTFHREELTTALFSADYDTVKNMQSGLVQALRDKQVDAQTGVHAMKAIKARLSELDTESE